MFRIRIIPRLLHFKQPAGTSRGVYRTRRVWYLLLTSDACPGRWGVGECAPLPDLSCDALPDYEQILERCCCETTAKGRVDTEALRNYPSILFGLETAFRHFERQSFSLEATPFSTGKSGIPINGLIWMGDHQSMLSRIEEKMSAGFRCIKLKIGAIDFEQELDLLRHIRKHYSPKDIELRVDANGAFAPKEVLEKLQRLSEWGIHSIEQPIKAGQWEAMARLAHASPIPIALDEELIGRNQLDLKEKMLTTIRPHYIILKPSLHGGISGSEEWIHMAERHKIGWWITSALESNIGLNSIAHWCSTRNNPMPQGLGTGALFTDNIDMPLSIKNDCLWYDPNQNTPDIDTIELATNTITVEGTSYSAIEIREMASPPKPELEELFTFLKEWFEPAPTITVQTSGSTGEPKIITVYKSRMVHSARMTCDALGLTSGSNALLCMSLKYIGAKMMVVRAIVCGMNLIIRPASGNPLSDINTRIDFAAMVPLQVWNSLQDKQTAKQLAQIDKLIIGGGAITPALEEKLLPLPNRVYSTYGMTETLSHIALRPINGSNKEHSYTPLPGVEITCDTDGCLRINSPGITNGGISTNDIVHINKNGTFRILGRKDNIINTGGVKIQIETVEQKLSDLISTPFAVTSIPDDKLGEAITLLVTSPVADNIKQAMDQTLSAYERPVHTIAVTSIPTTANDKTNRHECKQIAQSLISKNRPN